MNGSLNQEGSTKNILHNFFIDVSIIVVIHEGEAKMKKYEFKHVRMNHGIEGDLSKKNYEEKLERILAEMGDEGWDLKSFQSHFPFHTHLIFGREKD
jgi:homospermidine synthase